MRKNTYEPGRAHITIYNWAKAASVAVSLAQAGLNVGDAFEIRDAMNYFGAPVATGTYDGSSSVSIPMSNLQPAAPIGNGLTHPVHTAPQFGAFVLVRTTAGGGGRRRLRHRRPPDTDSAAADRRDTTAADGERHRAGRGRDDLGHGDAHGERRGQRRRRGRAVPG